MVVDLEGVSSLFQEASSVLSGGETQVISTRVFSFGGVVIEAVDSSRFFSDPGRCHTWSLDPLKSPETTCECSFNLLGTDDRTVLKVGIGGVAGLLGGQRHHLSNIQTLGLR